MFVGIPVRDPSASECLATCWHDEDTPARLTIFDVLQPEARGKTRTTAKAEASPGDAAICPIVRWKLVVGLAEL
jgi:hypothetical protein